MTGDLPIQFSHKMAYSNLQADSEVKFLVWPASWRPPGTDRLSTGFRSTFEFFSGESMVGIGTSDLSPVGLAKWPVIFLRDGGGVDLVDT